MTSATSRQPPRIAPRAWRTVIRMKVLTRPVPRLRATSSWPGSAARKLAAAGRNTSGYRASVMTTTAPRKPCAQFHSEAQPKLITKSGIASGTTISTTQTRRPGSRVRSVNQAAAVPRTAQATVTVTVSRTVFHSSSLVRSRKISRVTGRPGAVRLDQQEHQRHGQHRGHRGAQRDQHHRTPRTPGARRRPGGRGTGARRPGELPGRAGHSRPAWCIRAIAADPSPRSPRLMLSGWSWDSGVSPSCPVTPEAIGYS